MFSLLRARKLWLLPIGLSDFTIRSNGSARVRVDEWGRGRRGIPEYAASRLGEEVAANMTFIASRQEVPLHWSRLYSRPHPHRHRCLDQDAPNIDRPPRIPPLHP